MWLRFAWDVVRPSTIVKCFAKCGIPVDATQPAAEPVLEVNDEFGELLGGVTLHDFAGCDATVSTTDCAGNHWEADIVAAAKTSASGKVAVNASESEEEHEDEPPAAVFTAQQASEHLRELRDFGLVRSQPEFTVLMCKAISIIEAEHNKRANSFKQLSVNAFFQK